jgi:hypothetical protein
VIAASETKSSVLYMAVAECIAEQETHFQPTHHRVGYSIQASTQERDACVTLIGEFTNEARAMLDEHLWDLIQHHDTITVDCSEAPFISDACRATIDIMRDILQGSGGSLILVGQK